MFGKKSSSGQSPIRPADREQLKLARDDSKSRGDSKTAEKIEQVLSDDAARNQNR